MSFFIDIQSEFFVSGLCIVGILICIYAIDIEKSGAKKTQYKRICDVNESMSCTLVLTSKYGHMAKLLFNLSENSILNKSNAEYGLLFYIGMLLLSLLPSTIIPYHSQLFFLGTLSSVLASLGLAWILYAKLRNFCLICVTMYFINSLLLISSIADLVNN